MAPHSLFAASNMTSKGKSKHSASLGSLAPIGSQKPFWPPRRRCHSLHSNYMLNRGYACTAIISSKYHRQTLLSHLATLNPHSTPQAWQQKLNNGELTLNGVTATGSESVTLGQTLVWNRPPWIEPDSPQHFEVLFEDPHLLAVNKPSGLPTLPGGGFMETPLLRLVQKQIPNANPVHRLGRATTGIVLFAKTPQAAANLLANWNTPKIQKIYRALAQNIAQHDAYEILTPIGLVPHPLIGSVWAANPSGKPSKSLAKVISRTTSTTTFEVSLNSGRPHQIRIHLASIGHPLVGDPLYGLTGQPLENLPGLPGDGGYFLHAQFLKFHHPVTGEQINLEAALPSGFSLRQKVHGGNQIRVAVETCAIPPFRILTKRVLLHSVNAEGFNQSALPALPLFEHLCILAPWLKPSALTGLCTSGASSRRSPHIDAVPTSRSSG